MRPFSSWSDDELAAEARRATKAVLLLTEDFTTAGRAYGVMDIAAFCRELQRALDAVGHEKARLDDLADEIVLRQPREASGGPDPDGSPQVRDPLLPACRNDAHGDAPCGAACQRRSGRGASSRRAPPPKCQKDSVSSACSQDTFGFQSAKMPRGLSRQSQMWSL
jgi:hypothetical protein